MVKEEGMSEWTITIESALPMLNLNQRYHWAKKAQLTKHWRRLAFVNAMAAELPKDLGRVHIVAHVVKPTSRQYDVHNLLPTLKAAVDGLVDYGLIQDDTNQYLVGPDLRQGGKGNAAIIITITEIEED
jgi:crossover junction endodeoxyribonuclease RusA